VIHDHQSKDRIPPQSEPDADPATGATPSLNLATQEVWVEKRGSEIRIHRLQVEEVSIENA